MFAPKLLERDSVASSINANSVSLLKENIADPLELTWAAYIFVSMLYKQRDDATYNAHRQGPNSQNNVAVSHIA